MTHQKSKTLSNKNIKYKLLYIPDAKAVKYKIGISNLWKTMSCLIPDPRVVGQDDVTRQKQPQTVCC